VVPSTTAEGARSGEPGKDKVEYTGGVWYKIRWGDTLWEISSSFYDNPWLYDQIADENEIPNPDKIFAEDSIFIPKR
jgi:nucleoid-associated protein YgaU